MLRVSADEAAADAAARRHAEMFRWEEEQRAVSRAAAASVADARERQSAQAKSIVKDISSLSNLIFGGLGA